MKEVLLSLVTLSLFYSANAYSSWDENEDKNDLLVADCGPVNSNVAATELAKRLAKRQDVVAHTMVVTGRVHRILYYFDSTRCYTDARNIAGTQQICLLANQASTKCYTVENHDD